MGQSLPFEVYVLSVGVLGKDLVEKLDIVIETPGKGEGEVYSVDSLCVSEAKGALDTSVVFK